MRGCTGRLAFVAILMAVGMWSAADVSAVPLTAAAQLQTEEGAQDSGRGRGGETAEAAASVTGPFASSNVTLLGRVTPQSFSTNASCSFTASNVCINDVWGYVSPCGREYAIVGLRVGTGFVDISDPTNPVVVRAITDTNSVWSDMSTLDHYAYNVNESGGGLQIFNLAQIDAGIVNLVSTFTGSGLQTSHTIWVNEASRYLYLAGSNLHGGRLVAVNVNNPASPVIAGQAIDGAYVHETEVITYTEGPYAGREIAFCYCGGAGLKIIDVTNKNNMFTMSTFAYPNVRYCHQGSITADRQYIYVNDELDELQSPAVTSATTYVIDVSNLSSPQLVTTFTTGLQTIDHNLLVRGDYVFEANYTSGLRVFNIGDVDNIVESGWLDSYPINNGESFNGAWGVFTMYPSKRVVFSDMQYGLFVVDTSVAEGLACPYEHLMKSCANPNPKPRHLSVSFPPSDTQSALRLTITDMPAEFAAFVGSQYWVDLPTLVPDQKSPGNTIWQSRLTCEPVYTNWAGYGVIQIGDDEIVPGAAYELRITTMGCDADAASSIPLELTTAPLWGDVVGPGNTAPDGAANILDVATIVDVMKNISGSPDIAQTDLHPGEPDFVVNIIEVGSAVDAVKGFSFPYPGPSVCP